MKYINADKLKERLDDQFYDEISVEYVQSLIDELSEERKDVFEITRLALREYIQSNPDKVRADLEEMRLKSIQQPNHLPEEREDENIDIYKLAQEVYNKYYTKKDRYSLDELIQRSGGFIVGFKEGFNYRKSTLQPNHFSEEREDEKEFNLNHIRAAIKFGENIHNELITENDFINSLKQPNPFKVAIKGDGTEEYGKKIIEYFSNLGVKIDIGWSGNACSLYYYVKDDKFCINQIYPKGYTEISLKEEEKDVNNGVCKDCGNLGVMNNGMNCPCHY